MKKEIFDAMFSEAKRACVEIREAWSNGDVSLAMKRLGFLIRMLDILHDYIQKNKKSLL